MKEPAPPFCAAIEAGGTKFVVACGSGPDDLRDTTSIPTTSPPETLSRCADWLASRQLEFGPFAALGIGTFGPAGIHRGQSDWGFITTTPKPGWQHTDVAGYFSRALRIPVAFDTDVNAAALGEWLWGAGRGCRTALYLTIGTGIGGGFVLDGQPLHGALHPEMGHIRTCRAPDDTFPGHCPWHADCLEGMASGPAIAARWGSPADELPPDHRAWDTEAHYLAEACTGFLCTLSPERIILGGGVMQVPGMLDKVREGMTARLAGYLQHPLYTSQLGTAVCAPGLGSHSGILGAIALAHRLLAQESH
jgi:fructokinase